MQAAMTAALGDPKDHPLVCTNLAEGIDGDNTGPNWIVRYLVQLSEAGKKATKDKLLADMKADHTKIVDLRRRKGLGEDEEGCLTEAEAGDMIHALEKINRNRTARGRRRAHC